MRRGKATREQLKRHNRRLILRSIYNGEADNRAALAQATGLAKPTVSDIVNDLLKLGFIIESGHGESTTSGGKRPRLLEFVPTARQIIGLAVKRHEVVAYLAYLDGRIVAQHHVAGNDGEALSTETIFYAINGLLAQQDEPLLCISMGVPGIVDTESGTVVSSRALGWADMALASILQVRYQLPVHINNNTELAARAQRFTRETNCNHVTLLVNRTVEIGFTLGGTVFHHGGDIGNLPLPTHPEHTVTALTPEAIQEQIDTLCRQYPQSELTQLAPSYLGLRQAYRHGDEVAIRVVESLSETLALLYAWIIGLMRPDEIALAGSICDIGDILITLSKKKLYELIPQRHVDTTQLTLAGEDNLAALGAIAYALEKELGVL